MISLADTLAHLGRHVPEALVSPVHARHIERTIAHMPAAVTSWIHLECRLDDRPDVDVMFPLDPAAADILLGRRPSAAPVLPTAGADGAVWARILELTARWRAGDSDAGRAVGRLWLEYDVGPGPATPVPSVFIERPLRPLAPECRKTLAAAAALLMGGDSAAPLTRQLDACLAPLPLGAVPYAVGVMLSRRAAPVRLCIANMPRADLATYLAAVAWSGDPGMVARAVAPLLDAAGPAGDVIGVLHLDLADGVARRVGLEIVLARACQVRGELAEGALLDALVAHGLARPDKRDALHAWPGASRERLPHQLWPTIGVRRVNHVKLVVTADGAVEAKAYLCATHQPYEAIRGSSR